MLQQTGAKRHITRSTVYIKKKKILKKIQGKKGSHLLCMYKTLNAVLAVRMKRFLGAVVRLRIREWDPGKRLHVTKLILFSGNLKCFMKVSLPQKKIKKNEFVVSLINLQWHEEQKEKKKFYIPFVWSPNVAILSG